MKSFITFINEMAPPRDVDRAKVYYHGTESDSAIEGIMKNGINPPKLDTGGWGSQFYLRPVDGKAYMTPELRYAVIYTLGGDYIGHDFSTTRRVDPFGYLCVIDGKDIFDIQPDEDSIGELIYNKKLGWLNKVAPKVLSDETYEESDPFGDDEYDTETLSLYDAVMQGNYDAWAYAGKIILPYLSDQQKLDIIDAGAHIAHHGAITPSQIWKIEKIQSINLKRDCSNFWELAERMQ